MSNFKNMSDGLKPREKFILRGGESLHAFELLAILLNTGSKNQSVLKMTWHLLEKYDGIEGLVSQDIDELKSNDGIGESKALKIKVLYFLLLKIEEEEGTKERVKVNSPEKIYAFMKKYANLKEENFFIVCLAADNHIISYRRIFKGTLSSVALSPREIFKYALEQNSSKICLVHNHPSGNPEPSSADITVTKEINHLAQLIGIEVVDHIIIAQKKYCSIRKKYDIMF